MSAAAPSRLVIDTRPLWRVVLSRTGHWITLGLTAGLFAWLALRPPFEGLDVKGQRAVAVFVACIICWVTQAIPLSATGLLALFLLPATGVLTPQETFSLFGNRAVFFLLGAFILAAAVMQSGLSKRVAMILLTRVGTTPRRLVLGLMFLAAGLAHLMPEHAVAAMLLPIALEIARALRLRPGVSPMAAGMFLAMAWGAIIGGIATFLGGARNALAVEILHQATGQSIGFFAWWRAAFPLVALCLALGVGVLLLFFRPEIASTEPAVAHLRERLRLMGRPTLEERMVGVVLSLTILGWIFSEALHIDFAVVGLAGAVALFALRLISWRDVEANVNWGVLLMYGGAIALGQALSTEHSGAAAWMAHRIFSEGLLRQPTLTVLALAALALVLTEGLSNAAVVAMLMPLGLQIALAHDIEPRLVALTLALPAGLGFALPIASPPSAIAFSSGYIRPRHVLIAGPLLDLLCLLAFALVLWTWWKPILGLF